MLFKGEWTASMVAFHAKINFINQADVLFCFSLKPSSNFPNHLRKVMTALYRGQPVSPAAPIALLCYSHCSVLPFFLPHSPSGLRVSQYGE